MDHRLADYNRFSNTDLTDLGWTEMLDPNAPLVRKVRTVRKAASDQRVLDFMVKVQSSVWRRCNW